MEKAQSLRTALRQQFRNVFEDSVDFLITPTAATGPPPLLPGEDGILVPAKSSAIDEWLTDVMTVPASLAGLPAISVPWRWDPANPDSWIGVQVIGPFGRDEELLQFIKDQFGVRGK